MEYFLDFHWWYILVGLALLILFTGKGGRVIKRYSADLEVLDPQFNDCLLEADYSIFKEGKPEKIEIEVERLPLDVGELLELLELYINGSHLADMKVKKDKEAEFEHWSDGDVHFPKIREGDLIVIKYLGKDILKGTFTLH